MRKWLQKLSFMVLIAAQLTGCGYALQTSHNPLADKEGVRKIYIAPMINNTYKPGVENTVYNAVVQTLTVHRRVKIVTRPQDADAILRGYVNFADYVADASSPQSGTTLPYPLPNNIANENVLVASEYVATLGCSFSLERVDPGPGQRKILWTSGFSRSAPFGASNTIGTQGSTSSLINESEFARTIVDMATSMSRDMHESMLAMF
jgi:hypothetical protein